MRVHVKPAHPSATIPDLDHGDDLPAEGREVEWSAHWSRLQLREDVVVTPIDELAAEPEPPLDQAEEHPAA